MVWSGESEFLSRRAIRGRLWMRDSSSRITQGEVMASAVGVGDGSKILDASGIDGT